VEKEENGNEPRIAKGARLASGEANGRVLWINSAWKLNVVGGWKKSLIEFIVLID
jgi:hypothetical protein